MFVQRHFQKFSKRTADEQGVSHLLKDFEDCDQLLGKLADAAKAWKEAWISILNHQHRLFCEYDLIYAPIIGAGEDYQGHVPVETPANLASRTSKIKDEYESLKRDLTEDLNDVQRRMVDPAQEARAHLTTMKKVIKKREDKKLDYERYQSRVDTITKRKTLSDRDRAALTKNQADLEISTQAYNSADAHLKQHLPPLLNTVYSLQEPILAAQIQIQNTLLAHYYTMLHNYCTEEGFPSPSPPMEDVIRTWEDAFRPIQKEVEALPILASGKALRKTFSESQPQRPVAVTNGQRRPSQAPRAVSTSPGRPRIPSPSATFDRKPSLTSTPSASFLSPDTIASPPVQTPTPAQSPQPRPQGVIGYAPAGPTMDYFSRDRQQTTTSASNLPRANGLNSPLTSPAVTSPTLTPGGSSIYGSLASAKKRPPPPPPRTPSQSFQTVIALYDFSGQNTGDLSFKEGDKIRVIKKTESTDDWWQGELGGLRGMFPANYVQV